MQQGQPWVRKLKLVLLLTLCVAIGAGIAGSPVGAHVGGTIGHLWNKHIKPKTDNRYVNERESPWAVVNSNGTLARGSGVSVVVAQSTGVNRVYFTRNVTGCAFNATIGLAGNAGVEAPGFIAVVGTGANGPQGQPNERGVFVTTYDTSATLAARGFHLQVECANTVSPAAEVGARFGPSARRGGLNSR